MNIVESAKQATCSTAEILNIKSGSAARVEQELSVPRASQVLCIEGLDWFIRLSSDAVLFHLPNLTD